MINLLLQMIKSLHRFFGQFLVLIWVILLALILRWSAIEVYVIPFSDMLPTIFAYDHIMVNKLAYGLRFPFVSSYLARWSYPKRGDVIVFRTPFDSRFLSVRRVIGVPGDRLFFENGRSYLNGKQIPQNPPLKKAKDFLWIKDEHFSDNGITEDKNHYAHWEETVSNLSYSILLKKKRASSLIFGPYRIPKGYYFVMGDHRDRVQDSRTWPSGLKKAKGKVTFFRTQRGPKIKIPKGTLLRTDHRNPEYFETLQSTQLTHLSVDVLAQARFAGFRGNVLSQQIRLVEGNFPSSLKVNNSQAFIGGEDKNMVHESNILGRAERVLLSCEQIFDMLDFLCRPQSIRWGRSFLSIYY